MCATLPIAPTLCIDETVSDGDLLITMGAGDVTTVGPDYLEHVQQLDSDR